MTVEKGPYAREDTDGPGVQPVEEAHTGAATVARQPRLRVAPMTFRRANAFVATLHRHHKPVQGHGWSTGVADDTGELRGVAMVGRPVAHKIDHETIAEVTRVCTDGCPNACSFLYGATCRQARSKGYAFLLTYTLLSEPGTSLRAAGWKPVAVTRGGTWDRPGRPRTDQAPTDPKIRWECPCSPAEPIDLDAIRSAA